MLLCEIASIIALSCAGGFVAGRAYGIELVIRRLRRALADC